MSIKDEVLKEFEPMKIYETQEELGDELEVFVGWDEEDVEKMIDRTIQRIEKLIEKCRVIPIEDIVNGRAKLVKCISREELLKEIAYNKDYTNKEAKE